MAKCSAFLTLSVVRDGEPAPYVRLIYTVSDTKPSTPSGTAETVPDGWGLEVPVRADKKIVWVSSGVVSVVNGEYQYAEWSEPSRYTADATALSPIVQWKWGASDVIPPDEEESTVSVGDEAVLEVNGQAVTLSTNSTDWSSTIPDQPSDKPYLWKREWIYASEGVDAGWVYYCVTGKQGVEGSYNALGYTINGSSITFCGMDTDGKPTLASFRATLGGDVVLFQRKTFTISTDSNGEFHDRYFLVAYWENTTVGALALCYLTPVTETDSDGVASYRMKWVSQDGEEIATQSIDGKAYAPYVLADIRMVSGSATIKSVTLTIPATLKSYESDYFMSIMSSTDSDMDNINVIAKAMDIERVFEKVAALNAFINKLFANEITIMDIINNDGTTLSRGSIHSKNFERDSYQNSKLSGFFLESSGFAAFRDVHLVEADIKGSIHCYDASGNVVLETAGGIGTDLSFSTSNSYWNNQILYDKITTTNSCINATYDGNSKYLYKLKAQTYEAINESNHYYAYDGSGSSGNSGVVYLYIIAPGKVTIKCTSSGRSDSSNNYGYAGYTASTSAELNGKLVSSDTTLDVSTGDIIGLNYSATAYSQTTGGGGSTSGSIPSAFAEYSIYCSYTPNADTVYFSSEKSFSIPTASTYKPSITTEVISNSEKWDNKRLTFSGFDSNNFLERCDYTEIQNTLSNIMAYSSYALDSSSSYITYNGSKHYVTSITKTNDSISFLCTDGTYSFVFSSVGTLISGYLKFALQNTAVTVNAIMPVEGGNSTIGTIDKPIPTGYFTKLYVNGKEIT